MKLNLNPLCLGCCPPRALALNDGVQNLLDVPVAHHLHVVLQRTLQVNYSDGWINDETLCCLHGSQLRCILHHEVGTKGNRKNV